MEHVNLIKETRSKPSNQIGIVGVGSSYALEQVSNELSALKRGQNSLWAVKMRERAVLNGSCLN